MKRIPILISGGGPAGSLLALLLARRGLEVVLAEAGSGPRHKLCGEFLSGEAAGHLAAAGVTLWRELDGAPLSMVCLHGAESPTQAPLPIPAQGISRYRLDAAMRDAAVQAGARLMEGCRVAAAQGDPGDWTTECVVQGETKTHKASVLVAADGRRAALALPHRVPASAPYALKFHVDGAAADTATHLHFFRGGYGGVNAVENGVLNCCFILSRVDLQDAKEKPLDWLRERLGRDFLAGGAEIPATRCATGPLQFGRWRDYPSGLFSLGDAAVAIDPFCGDGMAMGMEAALIAAPLIEKAAAQPDAAPHFAAQLRNDLVNRFTPRLRAARGLRFLAMRRPLNALAAALFELHPDWLAAAARATRGGYDSPGTLTE